MMENPTLEYGKLIDAKLADKDKRIAELTEFIETRTVSDQECQSRIEDLRREIDRLKVIIVDREIEVLHYQNKLDDALALKNIIEQEDKNGKEH